MLPVTVVDPLGINGMPEVVFAIRLTNEDWDEVMRGWRCPVLSVPGAIVEAVYVEGNRIDSARYEVLQQNTFLRWIAADHPHVLRCRSN